MTDSKLNISRRQLLGAASALPLFSIATRPAFAAEFNYKFATGQDPSHPVNKRAQEAIDRIRNATNGRLDIKLFPANQLGSDTDLLSQVRSGGVEFFNQASVVLSTLVPAAGIVNTGFAFHDYNEVWKAMDGPLGTYVRAQIEKVGLLTMSKPWDNGFRNVTTSTKAIKSPDDLKGLEDACSLLRPCCPACLRPWAPARHPLTSTSCIRPCKPSWWRVRKPAGHHQHSSFVRSAKALQSDESRVGCLLDSGQPQGDGASAQRHSRDRLPRNRQGRD